MTSKKQAEANRRNATRSTGPRSEDGKKRSALNALQHGLTAEPPVLPTEDPGQYDELRAQMIKDLAPQGAVEAQLAEEIVDLTWRLMRATKLESGVLAKGVASVDERYYRDRQRSQEVWESDILTAKAGVFSDKLIEVLDEEAHDALSVHVGDASDVQRSDEVRLASAYVEDAAGPNALSKLTRHETSLFRRRNQAHATLAALQAERTNSSQAERKTE
jgi:hypothetical protein